MFENTESGLMADDGVRADDFNEVYEAAPVDPEPSPEKTANRWALRDRLRSKVLWLSVIAEVVKIAEVVYQWIKYGITPEGIEIVLLAVLAVLSIFGIVNDPTNREGF